MLRGFYTAATGMIAQQRRTEMLTNNMSNANTPGFKADQTSMRAFPEMLLSQFGGPSSQGPGQSAQGNRFVGGINTGVYMQEAMPAFMQGDLEQTGNNSDLAIVDQYMPVNEENGKQASVFFILEDGQGSTAYTRNGNFTRDQQGYLTTPAGHYVLDASGQRIQLSSDVFQVGEDGSITVNGEAAATLGIAYASDPYLLQKQGTGYYVLPGGEALPLAAEAENASEFSIRQGAVERSNVDTGRTMTEMMTAYRSFEANQKVLQAYDQSMQKTVSEIGRL